MKRCWIEGFSGPSRVIIRYAFEIGCSRCGLLYFADALLFRGRSGVVWIEIPHEIDDKQVEEEKGLYYFKKGSFLIWVCFLCESTKYTHLRLNASVKQSTHHHS
jgi:hypothetical protein